MTHPLNRLSTITKTKLETILMCVILGRIAFALSEQSSERANANFFRHKRSFDDSWFDCNIFAPSLTKIPGAEEMCHGRAFLLCGPLLQGCSWMTEKRVSEISVAHQILPIFCWLGILTPRSPPARRSRRKPWGHIYSDRVLPVDGSWPSVWWQVLRWKRLERGLYKKAQ